MLDPDLLHRLELARQQVQVQHEACRRLRRKSKALQAAGSAVSDAAVALKLAVRGPPDTPTLPMPPCPPQG